MKMSLFAFLLWSTLGSIVFAGPRSMGESFYKWKKKEVKVCWNNTERIPFDKFDPSLQTKVAPFPQYLITASLETKQKIKEAVTTEFTLERTGIHFSGWQDCAQLKDFDAMIFIADTRSPDTFLFSGRASIGTGVDTYNYKPTRIPSLGYVFVDLRYEASKKIIGPDDYIKNLVLHEFGHLAGLRHEHIRKEAKDDIFCFEELFGETPGKKTDFFSTYDPSSIMNYCFNYFVEEKAGIQFYSLPLEGVSTPMILNNLQVFSEDQLSQYVDNTLISRVPHEEGFLYELKVGLSKKDVHSLKCLYQHDPQVYKSVCHENYEP